MTFLLVHQVSPLLPELRRIAEEPSADSHGWVFALENQSAWMTHAHEHRPRRMLILLKHPLPCEHYPSVTMAIAEFDWATVMMTAIQGLLKEPLPSFTTAPKSIRKQAGPRPPTPDPPEPPPPGFALAAEQMKLAAHVL